jgi:NADPH-dependent 2,4-dienoyl-CoA reductase/sulfur reductase-like enzyme
MLVSPRVEALDVLLIGGGVAAARCARTLRRRGFAGSILLVGDEQDPPYNRPPLSKEALRGEVADELLAVEPAAWYERRRVGLLVGTRVVALDPVARIATLDDGLTSPWPVRFEQCLLASGAEARRLPIPGAERALSLRSLADVRAIRKRARPGLRAAVVGGGFIGTEVAASLADREMSVTLLETAPALWGGALGEVLSAWAVRTLERAGVTVRLRTQVSSLEPGGALVGGGEVDELVAADLLIAGVGVAPRVGLAEGAGLLVDDGVLVDDRQATSAAGIFAAGDVARPRAGERVEHWHAARETAERAALAMLGEPMPRRRAGWIYSDFAGQHLDVVGSLASDPGGSGSEPAVLGDPGSDRFVVAWSGRSGQLVQLAAVGGALAPEEARRLVEGGATLADLPRQPAD